MSNWGMLYQDRMPVRILKPTASPANRLRYPFAVRADELPRGRGTPRVQRQVVAVTPDPVLVDIGFKTEGILPLADFTTPEKQ